MKNFLAKKFKNYKLKYISILVIAVFFFGFGYFFGNFSQTNIFSSAAAAEEGSGVNFIKVFHQVQDYLNTNFIPWQDNYVPPTEAELNYGMIKGYVNAYGDVHTQFFSPTEAKQFEQNVEGSFGGIGAVIGYENNLPTVISLLKDNPAEKVGLKSGDTIVKVNDTKIENMTIEDVVSLIRGKLGTTVVIGVIHKGSTEITTYNIVRATIQIPIIKTEILGDTFIIHFSSFTENSATEFEHALREFMTSGKSDLIIDLRGNGGGYLDSAINIASLFLPESAKIVIEKNNKYGEDKIDYSKGYNYLRNYSNLKIGVLVDSGTASAAEILTGALKDNGVATVIGENTYGKGSVQRLFNLSDGSAVKITIEKWYTPNGVNISLDGITPDTIATSTPITLGRNAELIDSQLNSAIQDLRNSK